MKNNFLKLIKSIDLKEGDLIAIPQFSENAFLVTDELIIDKDGYILDHDSMYRLLLQEVACFKLKNPFKERVTVKELNDLGISLREDNIIYAINGNAYPDGRMVFAKYEYGDFCCFSGGRNSMTANNCRCFYNYVTLLPKESYNIDLNGLYYKHKEEIKTMGV